MEGWPARHAEACRAYIASPTRRLYAISRDAGTPGAYSYGRLKVIAREREFDRLAREYDARRWPEQAALRGELTQRALLLAIERVTDKTIGDAALVAIVRDAPASAAPDGDGADYGAAIALLDGLSQGARDEIAALIAPQPPAIDQPAVDRVLAELDELAERLDAERPPAPM